MRVAAIDEPLGSAWGAARPIALIWWRVVMALTSPSLQRSGSRNKVKPALIAIWDAPVLTERGAPNQARVRTA